MTSHVRRRTRKRRDRSRGITTMEVLVGSIVSMIVLLAIMGFFDAQQKAFATMNAYARSQDVTRSAVDLLAREIRMSSYDPQGTALPLSPGPTCPNVRQGLTIARPNTISIQQDLNNSGALDTAGENVMYFVSGNEIRRLDVLNGNAVATLVTGVQPSGLEFRYFDGASPPNELVPTGSPPSLSATQRACVEKVQIRIRANVPSPVANGTPLRPVIESGVAIRNRSLGKF